MSFDGSANANIVVAVGNDTHTHAFGNLTGKPTTLSGYGITDAATISALDIEKARIDAILVGAGANADTFAEVVTLINSVDTTNDTAFAGYVTSNNARSTTIETNVTNITNNKVDKVDGKQLSTEDYSTAEKTKLAGIAAGAQVNVATDLSLGTATTTTIPLNSSTGTDVTLPAVTTTTAGLMISTDKTKLDGIATNANNYVLPAALSTAIGGVKVSATAQTVTANAVSATAAISSNLTLSAALIYPATEVVALGNVDQLILPAVDPAISTLPLLVVLVAGTCKLPSVVGCV